VNEALNGRRKISTEQARKLGKLFRVNPGLFIQASGSESDICSKAFTLMIIEAEETFPACW
jgi:hypothetical protein